MAMLESAAYQGAGGFAASASSAVSSALAAKACETRVLTTDGLAHSQRLPYWRDFVCETFVELNCRSKTEEPFSGTMVSRASERLQFTEVRSTTQTVTRDKNRISASSSDCFLLSLQVAGDGCIVQNGREAALQPGSFALYDTTRPYELRFQKSFSQLVLRLPRQAMLDRLTGAEDLTALAAPSGLAQTQMAGSMLTQLADHLPSLDPVLVDKLEQNALDLIASALAQTTGAAANAMGQSQLILSQRILGYIDANLRDEDLKPETIATAHRISERYLRKLFEKRGSGVAEWIWRRRLENARLDLRDAAKTHLSVSSIAYAWGFKDPAHFSRAFKAQFGQSPRAFRTSTDR